MTMSEDHICFCMLCFHVNQGLFMFSANNFTKILFLTHDVVRSYAHDREHAVAFLSPYNRTGGTTSINWPTTRLRRGVDPTTCTTSQVLRHRFNHGLECHTSPPPQSCCYVTLRLPAPHSD